MIYYLNLDMYQKPAIIQKNASVSTVFYVLFSKLLIIVCTSRKRTKVCTSGSIPQIPKIWIKIKEFFFQIFFSSFFYPQAQHQRNFRLIKFPKNQGFYKNFVLLLKVFYLLWSSSTGSFVFSSGSCLTDPEKLFIRFIALIALNQRCQRRRAKYFRIRAVSKLLRVSGIEKQQQMEVKQMNINRLFTMNSNITYLRTLCLTIGAPDSLWL